MHPFQNKAWLETLAAELPQVNVTEAQHYLRLTHQRGLTIGIYAHGNRLQFSAINLHALYSTNTSCPIQPPPPITVDSRRAVAKLARELHRRLITPALPWYDQATTWQIEDNIRFHNEQRTRAELQAIGGCPHPNYSQVISGHHWRAQVNSADSITLHLESLPAEKALAIVRLVDA